MWNGQKHGDYTKIIQQKYITWEDHPTFRSIRLSNPFDFISRKPLNHARLWLKCPCLQQYCMRNKQKYGVYTLIMKQKYIMQTQFDFAGDFFTQNHSTFRRGIPLRLWERFDFDSTFKPVRLWQRDVDRRTLTAAPSGPADMLPRTAPAGQNVPFGCIFR